MTTQTLTGVTLQTVENYRRAATQAVTAYRVGSQRLLSAVDGALENGIYPRTPKLAPRATERMDAVRGNLSRVVAKGIDQLAALGSRAIESGSTTATEQVSKVAEFAAGVNSPIVASGLQNASRLSLPGAKLGLMVSSKLAARATDLVHVVGGSKPVKQAVRKAAAGAQRATRKPSAQLAATVKTTAKRAARVAKPVAVRKAVRRTRAAK